MAFLTSVKCETKKYQKFGGYFGILWQLVNAIGDSYIIQMSGKSIINITFYFQGKACE